MKDKFYFSYLNCKSVPLKAIELFNYYCSTISKPENEFSIWLDSFSEKNIFTLTMGDIWTRLFMKDHPIRFRLNAAVALIECKDTMCNRILLQKKSNGHVLYNSLFDLLLLSIGL